MVPITTMMVVQRKFVMFPAPPSYGRPSRSNRAYEMPMSTAPTTKTTAEIQGLRTLMFSLRRLALMRSMILVRATTRRLKTSVTKKIATRQPTVSMNDPNEKKKWKFAICVLKSEAVKNTMSCESPTPKIIPSTSETSETKNVSSAMMRATCPRLMPST